MQSVSPNPRFGLALVPGRVWDRTRGSMAGGVGWSAVLILLLTLMIARSTATAAWVGGIDIVAAVALGGAVVMGVLALAPIPWALGLSAGLIAAPIVAGFVAGPALHNVHPGDTLSVGLIATWWTRLSTGSAPGDPFGYAVSADPSFYLFLISMLMWVTGGWLSWCILRWRRPMLGLVPGAAAFATNLLNYPADQNGYTLAILVLTLALLLWTNYTSSIANATRARVKLTGDARWDFWESGLVAMAALIVVAILLPPLSTEDKTTQVSSSVFSSWAKLQQRLSHPTVNGRGNKGAGVTGFSTEVSLSGPLKKTHEIVFTYTFTSSSGPRYFRGVNVTQTSTGQWRYQQAVRYTQPIPKNQVPQYAEDYEKLLLTTYQVKMVAPPFGNSDILFYPGVLWRTDRQSVASEVNPPLVPALMTIDRLSSVSPPVSLGTYVVATVYSTATPGDLKQAGTAYPDWLSSYASLPPTGYRSKEVLTRIHQLAVDITDNAHAVTPYDKAKAIESYLRTNYKYTLDVTVPNGADPISYFLFDNPKGYCEFFASAMGDMLRSLGIPTRLVNGFGPGTLDSTTATYVVRGEDAHTWVEVYFPRYGWIPFEPTPDNVYTPIQLGVVGANPCFRADTACDNPAPTPGGVPVATAKPGDIGGPLTDPGLIPVGGTGFSFRVPDAGTLMRIAGILLAIILLVFAVTARYLRPRKVAAVWKRTQVLARLAGAERRTGETPLELARRLAHTFPEASGPVRSLAEGFVVSAYAPPDLAGSARASIMESWAALRPILLRRVASRLHLTRA